MKRTLLTIAAALWLIGTMAQERLIPASNPLIGVSPNYHVLLWKNLIGNESEASMLVAPSFEKEYSLTLTRNGLIDTCTRTLTYRIVDSENSIWEDPDANSASYHPSIRKYEIILDASDAKSINDLIQSALQTMRIPNLDFGDISEGCDGTCYYFSLCDRTGTCWSPAKDTNCEELVAIGNHLTQVVEKGQKITNRIRNEIRTLTRRFKQLRRLDGNRGYKSIMYTSGENNKIQQATLYISYSILRIFIAVDPLIHEEEALTQLDAYEPAFQEVFSHLYDMEDRRFDVTIHVVESDKRETVTAEGGSLEMILHSNHLSVKTILRLYDYMVKHGSHAKDSELSGSRLCQLLRN